MRFPPRLITQRTVLRAWHADDGPLLKAAVDHNKHHLKPWVPWATGEDTPLPAASEKVASMAAEFAADRNWLYAVLSPDEQRVIGGVGLHDRIGPGGLEVGYWIDRDHINQGLATEVAGALVDLALADLQISFLEMHIDERNVASTRVPQRLGFAMVEMREEPGKVAGEPPITMTIWRRERGAQ
jgi:RimJ/RimL family protein N-acetyltransferase